MSPKFSFFIPYVFIPIFMKHIMWWQVEELMTDELMIWHTLFPLYIAQSKVPIRPASFLSLHFSEWLSIFQGSFIQKCKLLLTFYERYPYINIFATFKTDGKFNHHRTVYCVKIDDSITAMGRPHSDLGLPTTKHERVLDLTTLSYNRHGRTSF